MSEFVLDETRKVGRGPSQLRVPSVDLVVLEGPARGARAHLPATGAKVGSAPTCTLVLADPTVSRVHLEIRALGSALRLRDAGSTNGTYIGGVRIHEADIPVGTVVRLGGSAFRVDAREDNTFVAISERTELGELVGSSLEMRALYAVLERVAPTDTTVLVQGETGTGKDVAARSIHALSSRSAGPFVPIDCGAIPEHLFESELFGHLRGAFTGAVSNRKGVFEEAAGGTLFLDEIGEMPLSLQPKLLRALETRTVRRVGASTAVPVDVRVVAATNRSLAKCVNDGTFREDLYYRLAVVEVAIPPLRDREGDVAILANRFFERLTGQKAPLDPAFVAQLAARSWPGNVRELRNFIERAVAMGQARPSTGASVAPPPPTSAPVLPPGAESIVPLSLPLKEAREAWTREFERIYVEAMLRKTGGNVTRAAEAAGVSRRFLQRLCARLGVRAADLDDDE
jgi:transcriptional regulator with PAS, ATPase and Fis domain